MKKYQKYIFYFENSFPVYNWVQRLFCIKAWNLIAGGEIVHCIKKIYYAIYLKPTKSTLLFRNGLNCQKIYFTCVCLVVVIIIIKWYRNGTGMVYVVLKKYAMIRDGFRFVPGLANLAWLKSTKVLKANEWIFECPWKPLEVYNYSSW